MPVTIPFTDEDMLKATLGAGRTIPTKRPDLAALYAQLAKSSEEAPDYSGVQRVAASRADKSNLDLARGLGMQMFGGKTMSPTGRQITANAVEQGNPLRANASDVGYYDPQTGEFVENPAMRQGRTEKALTTQIASVERGEQADAARAALKERTDADRALREAIAKQRNTTQIYLGDQRAARGANRLLPAAQSKAWIENNTALGKIDEAIAAATDNPDAFGAQNYLPEFATQRLPGQGFEGGVSPRAKVADIGSLKIHDRSGAAVTAAEFPRLRPFIPQATDNAPTVAKKLANLKREYELMNTEISNYAEDMGYRAPTAARGAGASGNFDAPAKPAARKKYNPNTGLVE